MEKIFETIAKRRIEADGRNPIKLDSPNCLYFIKKKTANVFIAPYRDGKVDGFSDHIFELREGQLMVGIPPKGDYSIRLVGTIGTRILEVSVNDLLSRDMSDTEEAYISSKLVNSLEEFSTAVFPRIKAMELMDEMLSEGEEESLLDVLKAFGNIGGLALCEASSLYEDAERVEAERLAKRDQLEKEMLDGFSESVKDAVKNIKIGKSESRNRIRDSLDMACKIVCDAMAIEMSSGGSDILEIAENNFFEVREISIRGDAFSFDIGPFLGITKEKEMPLAVLPNGAGKYKVFYPDKKNGITYTKRQIKDVFSQAFIFYKNLPKREIRAKDLLKFATGGIERKDLLTIAFAGLIGGLLSTSVPIATGLLFNNIIPDGNKFSLFGLGLVLLSITLSNSIFKYAQLLSVTRMEGKIEARVQSAVWSRLLSLPIPFFSNYNPFELTIKVNGVDTMRKVLSMSALTSIMAVFFIAFNGILLMYFNFLLAMAVLGLALLSCALTIYIGMKNMKTQREIIRLDGKVSGLILETVNGISKVSIAGAQRRAFHRWSKEFLLKSKVENQSERRSNMLETFNQAYPIIVSLIIFYAVLRSGASNFSIGTFIAFYASYIIFFNSLVALSESFLSIAALVPIYENLTDILKELPEDGKEKVKCDELKGEIEIRNLTFKYDENGPTVIDDISLNVKSGEYVAIVGFSGSGKSTLLRILLGFEEYKRGKVYYDRHDMQKTDIRSIRKQIGVVLQNGKLMSGSIYSNIIGANTRLTLDDAWEAAKKAGLYDDIKELPMGMHTYVSEESAGLSGGQVQKILIARAIANKPKIIFFDEATSALDNKSQSTISGNMEFLSATRIVIAHRLSTIRKCDRIFVMDKGRIVEEGSYEELIQEDGRFTDLVKRQL